MNYAFIWHAVNESHREMPLPEKQSKFLLLNISQFKSKDYADEHYF